MDSAYITGQLSSVDSVNFLGLNTYSPEQTRVLQALKEKKMFKFLCGAGYLDFDSVKKYSEIFSRAGCHLISVSAHPTAVMAAHEGIANASLMREESPSIIINVSLDQSSNTRFRRAVLDQESCDNCGACVPTCPTSALYLDSEKNNNILKYQAEKCIGCGDCESVCHADAFSFESINLMSPDILPEMWSLGARFIEIYVGSNFYWLEPYLRRIKEISPHPWIFSIVLSSHCSSLVELQEQATEVYRLLGDLAIIQVDGGASNNYLSGNKNSNISLLRAISSASAILELEKPIFVQIAGGVNDSVKSLLNQFNLKVHGVSVGSYARKQIAPYLEEKEIAVAIAKKIVDNLI